MALPPSNTARYFMDYIIGGAESRTLQVRYESPAEPADVADWLEVMLSIFAPIMGSGWAVTGARVAAAGSNVTLPTVAPASPTPGGGTITKASYPFFVGFQGRDVVTGPKARLSLYGLASGPTNNYRLERSEATWIADALDFIQTPVTGVAISIAGNPVQWYDYLNAGFNGYHQRGNRK